MSNIATNMLKRVRTRPFTQCNKHFSPLNFNPPKRPITSWRPSIQPPDLKPKYSHTNGKPTSMIQMVTFSPFNPAASRSVILSSALPIFSSSIAHDAPPAAHIPRDPVGAFKYLPPTSSSNQAAAQIQQSVSAPAEFRPWPYKLPLWLQPQKGTTFDEVYGNGEGEEKSVVGLLQKVLYGVPEPGEASEKKVEGREGKKGIWEKIMYGVGEEDGRKGV